MPTIGVLTLGVLVAPVRAVRALIDVVALLAVANVPVQA